MIATALAFAIGIAATVVGSDYDSALMVVLRVGTLCAVVPAVIVAAHHALTRKRGSTIAKQ